MHRIGNMRRHGKNTERQFLARHDYIHFLSGASRFARFNTPDDKDDPNQKDDKGGGTFDPSTLDEATRKAFQSFLNEQLGKTRQEERDKLKKKQDEDDKKKQDDDLKEQGKHLERATTLEKENETLKTKAEQADAYATMINGNIDEEIASWPDELKELDPGKDNLEARSKWVVKARKLKSNLKGQDDDIDPEHGKHSKTSKAPETKELVNSYLSKRNVPRQTETKT